MLRGGLLLAAALLTILGPPVGATSMKPQDLAALAGQSSDVLRATVVSVESRWNDDKTLILTEVELAVTRSFKGAERRTAVVELHGGRVGDLVLDVVGSPAFQVGEEVLVLAQERKDGRLWLPYLAQDKYRIERDPDGSLWVRNDLYPLASLLPAESHLLDARQRLPLDRFLGALAASLQGGGR
jgi:hypothetical protein